MAFNQDHRLSLSICSSLRIETNGLRTQIWCPISQEEPLRHQDLNLKGPTMQPLMPPQILIQIRENGLSNTMLTTTATRNLPLLRKMAIIRTEGGKGGLYELEERLRPLQTAIMESMTKHWVMRIVGDWFEKKNELEFFFPNLWHRLHYNDDFSSSEEICELLLKSI